MMNSMRFFLFFILIMFSGAGQGEVDHQLEVALIYKISKFIHWPDEQKKTESFNICVLHHVELVSSLNVLKSRTIKSLPIKISYFDFSSEISPKCQVLFIPSSRKPYLSLIFKQLKNQPILTISTLDGFAKLGGMVESSISSNPIDINLEKVKASNLAVDSSLLSLANIVTADE